MHTLSTGHAAIRYMVAGGILFLMMEVAVVVPAAARLPVFVVAGLLAGAMVITASLRHCPVVEMFSRSTA